MSNASGGTHSSTPLQWSHDLSVVECLFTPNMRPRSSAASMEPRPLGRGMNPIRALVQPRRDRASMEPRPLGRGMPALREHTTPGQLALQWSHDLSVVEWPRPRGGTRTSHRRFNGATTSRSWNAVVRVERGGDCDGASMEPRPLGRGMRVAERGVDRRGAASMEPRPLGRGMSSSRAAMLSRT